MGALTLIQAANEINRRASNKGRTGADMRLIFTPLNPTATGIATGDARTTTKIELVFVSRINASDRYLIICPTKAPLSI
jgi:hypothetical protein